VPNLEEEQYTWLCVALLRTRHSSIFPIGHFSPCLQYFFVNSRVKLKIWTAVLNEFIHSFSLFLIFIGYVLWPDCQFRISFWKHEPLWQLMGLLGRGSAPFKASHIWDIIENNASINFCIVACVY
jgi:hypothetical protein